ncbi:MAG: hypothetical protein ACHQT5_00305 [Candidatus Saccharimonadales bacterium]
MPKRSTPTRVLHLLSMTNRVGPLVALARNEPGNRQRHRAEEPRRGDRPSNHFPDCSHRADAGVHLHDDVVSVKVRPRASGVRSAFDVLAVQHLDEGRHDGAPTVGTAVGSSDGDEDGTVVGVAGLRIHAGSLPFSCVRLFR